MSPLEHCEAQAVTAGSARYYTLLNTPLERRPALTVAFTLGDEMRKLALSPGSTPEVRQARLGWWLDEMTRLLDAKPRHPVSRASLECGLPVDEVAGLMQITLAWCSQNDSGETRALTAFCIDTGKPLGRVMAHGCGHLTNSSAQAVEDIGIGTQLFDLVPELDPARAAQDDFYLCAEQHLGRADSQILSEDRYALLPLLTLSELHQRSLQQGLRRCGAARPHAAAAWTPLVRLWLTWRVQRREAKRRR